MNNYIYVLIIFNNEKNFTDRFTIMRLIGFHKFFRSLMTTYKTAKFKKNPSIAITDKIFALNM